MPPTFKEDSTRPKSGNGGSGDPFAGCETEHIYIEDVLAGASEQPRTIDKQIRIRNRVRGTITELTFYTEGFLRIREGTPKRVHKDHVLELRFVDPNPDRRRHAAAGSLWATLAASAAALGALVVLPLTGLASYAFAIATILGTLAAVAMMLFLYKSVESTHFCTASGRTEVLKLTASFGCITKMRRAVRAIQRGIAQAGGAGGAVDDRYLRDEMQAHYRLLEKGVITQEACSHGTAQILAKFG